MSTKFQPSCTRFTLVASVVYLLLSLLPSNTPFCMNWLRLKLGKKRMRVTTALRSAPRSKPIVHGNDTAASAVVSMLPSNAAVGVRVALYPDDTSAELLMRDTGLPAAVHADSDIAAPVEHVSES